MPSGHARTRHSIYLTVCIWCKAQPMGVNKLNSILKDMCEVGGIPRKTNHGGKKTLVQKLQDNLWRRLMESISNILSSTASMSREVSDVSQRQRGAFHTTINFRQTHQPHHYMETSCKWCFMAIQLVEGFSTSLWPTHKVQSAAPNLKLQRKSFTLWCALSRTVGAVLCLYYTRRE